jgi:hypothetical protein
LTPRTGYGARIGADILQIHLMEADESAATLLKQRVLSFLDNIK